MNFDEDILKNIVTKAEEYPSKKRIQKVFEGLKELSQLEQLDRGKLNVLVMETRLLCSSAERFEENIRQIYNAMIEGKVSDDILHILLDFICSWTGYYIEIRGFRKKINRNK